MDLQLKNKVALITGGSKGIGLRTALSFAREGCHVALCARTAKEVEEAAEQVRALGVRVAAIRADVMKTEDCDRAIAECVQQLGALDILINNVGVCYSEGRLADGKVGLLTSTDDNWRMTYEGNVVAGVRLLRLAVPHMRGRPGAAVVNISSISGWHPQLTTPVGQYGASKAALIFIAEVLALELVRAGIRVNTVSPGSIICDDNSWDDFRKEHPEPFAAYVRDGFPMGRLGTPEEVADVIVFLASPRAHWINGRHIPVDGLEQPTPVNMFRVY